MNRRNFLQLLGLGAAAAVVVKALPAAEASQQNYRQMGFNVSDYGDGTGEHFFLNEDAMDAARYSCRVYHVRQVGPNEYETINGYRIKSGMWDNTPMRVNSQRRTIQPMFSHSRKGLR